MKITRTGDNGKPVSITADARGMDNATPVWEYWCPLFLGHCRDKDTLKGNVYAKTLKQVTDEEYRIKLKNGAWQTMSQIARDKAKGVFEGKLTAKKVRVMTHSRQTALSAHISHIIVLLTCISHLTGAPPVAPTLPSRVRSSPGCSTPSASLLQPRTRRNPTGASFMNQPGETKWLVHVYVSEANELKCYPGLRDL